MIKELEVVASQFSDGLISEKEFLGLIIQAIGARYTAIADDAPYSNDADIRQLCVALVPTVD